MVIDFHTHVFPDKIASKTVDALANSASVKPYSDGTLSGLLKNMEDSGVNISVTLPVLTKPTQFESVFNFASEVLSNFKNGDTRILPFCGIHPDIEDLEGAFIKIKEAGFKGIKIHPEYQQTFIDDPKNVKILSLAKKHGLITVTHAGVDNAYTGEVRCTPKRVLNALDKLGGYDKLVLAHFGGNELFDEVYNHLSGLNLYFDTAFMLKNIDKAMFIKILNKHGEDKILFATDSPWSYALSDINIIKSFCLPVDVENKILYKNAVKLLDL